MEIRRICLKLCISFKCKGLDIAIDVDCNGKNRGIFFRLQQIKEYGLGLQMYDLCFDDNHE